MYLTLSKNSALRGANEAIIVRSEFKALVWTYTTYPLIQIISFGMFLSSTYLGLSGTYLGY